MRDALKSFFAIPIAALYLVKRPNSGSKATSPPRAKPSLPMVPLASTIGNCDNPTLHVTLPNS